MITRLALGVRFQFAFIGDDDAELERIALSAFTEIDRLESILDNWDPNSPVTRFNSSVGTDWFAVPAELAEVVAGALDMHSRTGGAYDITILPALEAYGFGERARRIPDDDELRELAIRVGSEKIEARLDPPALRRKVDGVTIDISSATKGFVVDRIVERLRGEGIVNAFVSAGGSNVHAIGPGPDGGGWPFELDDRTVWRLRDEAVSTSGSSSRDAIVHGEHVGHIFDPRTLRPADRRIEMVCVRGPSGFVVDMASTALVVLGPDEGSGWFERDRDLADYRVWLRRVDDAAPLEFSGR